LLQWDACGEQSDTSITRVCAPDATLALDPLGILFFDVGMRTSARRDRHRPATLARSASSLGVKTIRLRQPPPARQQETCRIKDHRAQSAPIQQPSQPEAIVANLVAEHRRQGSQRFLLCLCLLSLKQSNQPLNVSRLDLVGADPTSTGRRKRQQPARLAEFQSCAAHIANVRLIDHKRAPLLALSPSKGGTACRHPLHRIYYDPSLTRHSDDAADPSVTARVLTVMLTEEY
jgi:hypothetical protein